MRLQTALSRRHLLGLLLALSVLTSLMGRRVARPLRHVTGFLVPQMSDMPMYLVTEANSRMAAEGPERLTAKQAAALRRENEMLRQLAGEWRRYGEVYRRRAEELANFQRMYGPTRDLACELIAAHVVAGGALPYDDTRMLSRNSGGGAPPGSPVTTRQLITDRTKALPPRLAVVDANYLVGRITASAALTARLQLVTDSAFQIYGRIRRVVSADKPRMITVTEGTLPRTTLLAPGNNRPIDVIAVGDGATRLLVKQVKAYHNVRPGDVLVTDPERGLVLAEIRIGKVVQVQPDPEDARRVTLIVEPYAKVASVRNVYIVSPVAPPAGGP